MLLQSTITCPHCATAKSETMPTDAGQFFYECTGSGTKLKPKSGDCCVFCSYGSVRVRQFKQCALASRVPPPAVPNGR